MANEPIPWLKLLDSMHEVIESTAKKAYNVTYFNRRLGRYCER